MKPAQLMDEVFLHRASGAMASADSVSGSVGPWGTVRGGHNPAENPSGFARGNRNSDARYWYRNRSVQEPPCSKSISRHPVRTLQEEE